MSGPEERPMRKLAVATVVMLAVLAWLSGPVGGGKAGRALADTSAASISINGTGGDKPFQGIGAILGGGGNARYLMDYPEPERSQILDYLFRPGYGASLQILKLEIGGGTNSSDGAEASVEPAPGSVNCQAGYEFAIAQQAVQRNPDIALYGLQWTAPSWVSSDDTSLFTGTYSAQGDTSTGDIKYLLDWLNCARNTWGLLVSYLGGWNENSTGSTYQWYQSLRAALDGNGYGQFESDGTTPNPWYVQLIAGDLFDSWEYYTPADSKDYPYPAISVLGAHDICGHPTEQLTGSGSKATLPGCSPPQYDSQNYFPTQPLWASELGKMDAGAESGCADPCAPAMARALTRGYLEARLTGYLEWPALDAMPETGSSTENETPLPYENRGLITADEPWSGYYSVRAMTWVIAHFTDFVSPPNSAGQWLYEDDGTGYLAGHTVDGAYVTFIHKNTSNVGDGWTTVIDTTTASASQTVSFSVTGTSGSNPTGLCALPVHVWSSDFNTSSGDDTASNWLQPGNDIDPWQSNCAISSYTLQPGYVYTFTTSTPATTPATRTAPAGTPGSSNFRLSYSDSLATAGQAGLCYNTAGSAVSCGQCGTITCLDECQTTAGQAIACDDEPQYLDSQDGSFELVPCQLPSATSGTCTEQTTVGSANAPMTNGDSATGEPVFWHPASAGVRYPYAVIGDGSWTNYTVSVNAKLTQPGTSTGLITYFTNRFVGADDSGHTNIGHFDGYVFDVAANGSWQLVRNTTADGSRDTLNSTALSGTLAPVTSAWNLLSLSMWNNSDGSVTITASVNSQKVVSCIDTTADSLTPLTGGLAGIETGFTNYYPETLATNDPSTVNFPQTLYSGLSVTQQTGPPAGSPGQCRGI
jgi:hypothetical protein